MEAPKVMLMDDTARLATEIDRAIHGPAWHGPSLLEALEGVDLISARRRPIDGAHSIAEVVLHATTWHEVVHRRLLGETPEVSDEQDWPAVAMDDEQAWEATVGRLVETGRALREVVRGFPSDKLHERRPGISETWYELISGELQHITYHAGQVAMLRKA